MGSSRLSELCSGRIKINLFLGVAGFKELFHMYAISEYYTMGGRRVSGVGSRQRGLGVFLFKELMRVEATCNRRAHYNTRGNVVNVLQTLRAGTTLLTYNTYALYLIFYNMFLFFYYSGGCDASFAILTSAQLEREGLAFNYLTQYHYGPGGMLRDQLQEGRVVTRRSIYRTRYWMTKYQAVDFLFFMDATLNNHLMTLLTQTPTHIVGLTTDVTNTFYFDTVLPFDAISIEVQYFFMECALYAYLAGRRAFVKNNVLALSAPCWY